MSRLIAWTGHRPDLFHDPRAARKAVDTTARDLVEADDRDVRAFLVGGQRGVDTWAALAAIDLAVAFELLLPLPLEEFTRDWVEADRRMLQHTLGHAAEVRITGGFTRRNQLLARGAGLLVAVWTGTGGGGTSETIALAREVGTPVREILLEASADAASARGRGI